MENTDLKKAGLKATLPRIKILSILDGSDQRHMSAEDVYKALLDAGEEVGLATVYRVLTQFEAAGLVIRHNFEGGHAVFELESRSSAAQEVEQVGEKPRKVLRMNTMEPFQRPVAQLAFGKAEQALPSSRQVDLVSPKVPVPGTALGGFER